MLRLQGAVIVAFALACVGCAETRPSQFYVLSSLPIPDNPTPTKLGGGAIAIGPIELPKYLDRSHIVTYASPNIVDLAEYHRWAEPLPDGFRRVLVEDLSVLLPGRRVEPLPFVSGIRGEIDRRVAVNVTRFHAAPDGTVELRASWQVLSADGKQGISSGTTVVSEPSKGEGYAATAAAMSRAIAQLSRELADAIGDRRAKS